MLNIPDKSTGQDVYSNEYNSVKNQSLDAVNSTGQTPTAYTPGVLTPDPNTQQLSIAMAIHAAGGNFYVDSGAADAYVLGVQTISGTPMRSPNVYFNGMTCRFVAGNTNTGASTVNVATLGLKTVKKANWTSDLEAGDIVAGFMYDIVYSTSTGFFELKPVLSVDAIPAPPTAFVKDVKATTTNGGTFTSGAWRTRDLNNLTGDTSFISLGSNQITLDSGRYNIEALAPASNVDFHKIKLYNISDASDVIIGLSERAVNSTNGNSSSFLYGEFTISASKVFEIQHYCSATKATDGFGNANSFGVSEVYTQVKIVKIA